MTTDCNEYHLDAVTVISALPAHNHTYLYNNDEIQRSVNVHENSIYEKLKLNKKKLYVAYK